ncbi:MAG: helix-turn-helix domain-containing protein [Chloroflexi bacterium]|nr:helix-turn-helix domain-containing protein [Chloroflexota bacterium]
MDEWLSLKEACKILRLAPNTVRKLIRTGDLRAYEIKGVRGPRFKKEDLEGLITPIQPQSPKEKVTKKKKS